MKKNIVIHKENYAQLPIRFANKLEADLHSILEAEIPGLKKVYLFGSCARGEARSSSDIDLLVITEEKISDRVLASDIRWSLDEALDGVRTDVVYQNEQSAYEDSVFRNVVNRDKKLILEVMDDEID